jgi:hypothetical protein
LIYIADGRMEKAGAYTPVDFDNSGNPWRVADWGSRRSAFDALPKTSSNPPQFVAAFADEPPEDVFLVPLDHTFDFVFQFAHLGSGKRDISLAQGRPRLLTIESCRRNIGRKEGNAIEIEGSGRRDRGTKICVIQLLHSGPAGYPHFGPAFTHRGHTPPNGLKRARYAANFIMHLWGSIDRDDYLVDAASDHVCLLLQQESCGEKRDPNPKIVKVCTNRTQLAIEQRFTSGQHNMLYAKPAHRFSMPFKIGGVKLAAIFSLPDIAHDTAAVALTVNIDKQDGQAANP